MSVKKVYYNHMRAFFTVVVIVALVVGAGAAVWHFVLRDVSLGGGSSQEDKLPLYIFDDAGLSFNYPRSYVFESYPLEDETDSWVSLMLVRAKDKQSAEENGASEGPVAITISIFTNTENLSADEWVRTSPHSNFALSKDNSIQTTSLGGEQGVSYTHSGLYESDAVAVAHGDSIYLFEGSWAAVGDSIRTDFQNLLKTVKFK